MNAEILHLASEADLVSDLQAMKRPAVDLPLLKYCYPPFARSLVLSLARVSDLTVVRALLSLTAEGQIPMEQRAMWMGLSW